LKNAKARLGDLFARRRSRRPTLHALLSNSPLRDLEFGEAGERSPVRRVEF
jgi:hypothetical protein